MVESGSARSPAVNAPQAAVAGVPFDPRDVDDRATGPKRRSACTLRNALTLAGREASQSNDPAQLLLKGGILRLAQVLADNPTDSRHHEQPRLRTEPLLNAGDRPDRDICEFGHALPRQVRVLARGSQQGAQLL